MLLTDGPADAPATLVLAHGAGAPMDSAWMNDIASALAANNIRVVRFEFPYMRERRLSGKRRPPDREAVLLNTWREVVAQNATGAPRLYIGGKSMGGRMASMVADELGVAGLLCFGYPFHAPGRPDAPRIAHLETLKTPALFLQGTDDPFGKRDEVLAYPLSPAITIHWIESGNHDLVPKGPNKPAARASLIEAATMFMAG